MKRLVTLVLLALFSMGTLSACNTMKGAGKDVQKVVDRPGVQAQEEWVEQVPIQKYIRYTAEELAAQEEARKKAEAREKLPETVEALQKENKMLKQCLLEMSEIVYA